MKSVVADYRYRCHGLRIECTNGIIVRLTDYPRDLNMGAVTYRSDSGYQFTGSQASTSMSAGVMDLEGVATATGIGIDQVASGVFDGARLYVFATTWRTPVENEEPIGAAILGRTIIADGRYKIEMMALIDALNQSVGQTYSAACKKELGGQEYAGCKVNLAPLTVTGTISHVTSNTIFRDSSRAEEADWFGLGSIRFTTGDNVGLRPLEIKAYLSNGTVETFEPAYYPVQVGDQYEMIPGCRKRHEDCKTKFNNVINFGGFRDVPVSSQYQSVGTK